MAARTLIVDGYDLGEIGYVADNAFRDTFGSPQRKYETQAVHSRIGEQLASQKPSYSVRQMIVNGAILADDLATLNTNIDALKYRLYAPSVGVRLSHDETREYVARCDQVTIDRIEPALIQRGAKVAVRFTILDPRMRAIADTVQAFTTGTAIALGTAESKGVIRLTGGTNPTVVLKDYAATEIGRMEFTWAGTWLDVDLDEQTIIDNAAANQASTLTVGNFFALDPRDGDYLQSQWPTLDVTGGGTAQITYRKMYW